MNHSQEPPFQPAWSSSDHMRRSIAVTVGAVCIGAIIFVCWLEASAFNPRASRPAHTRQLPLTDNVSGIDPVIKVERPAKLNMTVLNDYIYEFLKSDQAVNEMSDNERADNFLAYLIEHGIDIEEPDEEFKMLLASIFRIGAPAADSIQNSLDAKLVSDSSSKIFNPDPIVATINPESAAINVRPDLVPASNTDAPAPSVEIGAMPSIAPAVFGPTAGDILPTIAPTLPYSPDVMSTISPGVSAPPAAILPTIGSVPAENALVTIALDMQVSPAGVNTPTFHHADVTPSIQSTIDLPVPCATTVVAGNGQLCDRFSALPDPMHNEIAMFLDLHTLKTLSEVSPQSRARLPGRTTSYVAIVHAILIPPVAECDKLLHLLAQFRSHIRPHLWGVRICVGDFVHSLMSARSLAMVTDTITSVAEQHSIDLALSSMETLRDLLDIDCRVLLASLGINAVSLGEDSLETVTANTALFNAYHRLYCPIIPGKPTMANVIVRIASGLLPAAYIEQHPLDSSTLALSNVVQVLLQSYKLPGLTAGMLIHTDVLTESLAAYSDTMRFQFMYQAASSDDPQALIPNRPVAERYNLIESSLLMFAYELDNLILARHLVRLNSSRVVVDSSNLTLLHRAVRLRNRLMVHQLLSDPNPDFLLVQQDPARGLTPLHVAIETDDGHWFLERLLMNSSNPRHLIGIKDNEALRNSLIFACSRNNLAAVHFIIANFYRPPHAPFDLLERDYFERTALQHAIYQRDMPMIDFLLLSRSPSDVLAAMLAKTGNSRTTLMGAAFFGFIPFMEDLAARIERYQLSSLMMATDIIGRTFLHFAATVSAAVFDETVDFIMRSSDQAMLIHLLNVPTKLSGNTPLDEIPSRIQTIQELHKHVNSCLATVARHLDQRTISQLHFIRHHFHLTKAHRVGTPLIATTTAFDFDHI